MPRPLERTLGGPGPRARAAGWCTAVALLTGCAGAPVASTPAASPSPSPAPSDSAPPLPSARPTAVLVEVRYRVDVRTPDAATRDAAAVIDATLEDARGWQRAGFDLVRDDTATFLVVLAEPDEVDRLCRPYDTGGKYSCQNGPVVALNADRWRTATPTWTGDLPTYRQMLVNHEVGHLLGQHHPDDPQCPVRGLPALVMSQQSTELNGCLPNPWPLQSEVDLAARHTEPLAPPYEP